MAGVHDGHRQRMRDRAERSGYDGFQEHEVLEMLLYPLIPRRDTNEIAHRLLTEFGSLAAVLDASGDDLARIKGMTDTAARYLHMLPSVFARYNTSKAECDKMYMGNPRVTVEYLRGFMSHLTVEEVYLLCLDSAINHISTVKMSRGIVSESALYPRDVVKEALKHNSRYVILAHNHPSGDPSPSEADRKLTSALALALKQIDIPLLDHIIIAGSRYHSFKQEGFIDDTYKAFDSMINKVKE